MTNKNIKLLLTGVVVLVAAGVLAAKYWYYLTNPWTRDGQVHAQVIQIAPRVSGPIVKLPINDNQMVKAGVMVAEAALRSAQLDLEFTHVRAAVDGYVANLNLRVGSQAVANQPALALIDINSYWVHGFFREDQIEGVQAGDRAIVTLMSYPDRPLEGRVDSLGWGIEQDDGSTGYKLLPKINATFEWIRLAQRVPVRIHLVNPPKDIPLRAAAACIAMRVGEENA